MSSGSRREDEGVVVPAMLRGIHQGTQVKRAMGQREGSKNKEKL